MASTPWGGGQERAEWDLPRKGLLRKLQTFLDALENYHAICRQTLNIRESRGLVQSPLSWCENQAIDPNADFKDSGVVEIVEIPEFLREVDIAQVTWQPGAEAELARVFSLQTWRLRFPHRWTKLLSHLWLPESSSPWFPGAPWRK